MTEVIIPLADLRARFLRGGLRCIEIDSLVAFLYKAASEKEQDPGAASFARMFAKQIEEMEWRNV